MTKTGAHRLCRNISFADLKLYKGEKNVKNIPCSIYIFDDRLVVVIPRLLGDALIYNNISHLTV
jgi:hypothetical protein